MAYMIFTRDRAGGAGVRDAHRAQHYAYLRENAHRLIVSGGIQDENGNYVGGLIVLNVDTHAEAEVFAAADPFGRAELFDQVIIMRWVQAFFGGREDRGPFRPADRPAG